MATAYTVPKRQELLSQAPKNSQQLQALLEQEQQNFVNSSLQYIRNKRLPVKRGDFILEGIQLGEGYRNEGKFMFDGAQLVNLSSYPDDYGTIPEQFQVIVQFPILYWDGFIDHNSYVPFDVRRHLGNLQPQNMMKIRTTDGKFHLAYAFKGPQGNTYYIISADTYNQVDHNTITNFLNTVQNQTYFQFISSNSDFRVPPKVNRSQLLVQANYPITY